MLRNIALLLTLVPCAFASISSAQEFDNFRFVGENTSAAAGFVTGVSLNDSAPSISFLNAAGLSTVYNIELHPSRTIGDNTSVSIPPGFSEYNIPSLNLEGVQFMTATLADPSGAALPSHWFRLTRYNNRWSGVFRIADRIYAIDRDHNNNIVDVRHTKSDNKIFQPTRRLQISALIDEQYLLAPGQHELAHLQALESIHVMDGLLSDTLGTTVHLDQLIYQPSSSFSGTPAADLAAGAHAWLNTNAAARGMTGNYASLFFREAANDLSSDSSANPQTGITDNGVIIQGSHAEYFFTTAHYFGKLLGLDPKPLTIQHWTSDGEVALASVDWTHEQKALVDSNPPAAEFIQLLSYDAPTIANPAPEVINEIPEHLVGSELGESTNPDPLLQSDPNTPTTVDNGGGALSSELYLLLSGWLWTLRRRKRTSSVQH